MCIRFAVASTCIWHFDTKKSLYAKQFDYAFDFITVIIALTHKGEKVRYQFSSTIIQNIIYYFTRPSIVEVDLNNPNINFNNALSCRFATFQKWDLFFLIWKIINFCKKSFLTSRLFAIWGLLDLPQNLWQTIEKCAKTNNVGIRSMTDC